MTVAADDEVARPHQPLLGQHDVGDPLAPLVVDVGDSLLPRPPTYAGEHGGGGDVLGRDDVVENDHDLLGIEDPTRAHLVAHADRPGRGEIVSHIHVDFTVTNSPGSTAARPAGAARVFSLVGKPLVLSRPRPALP